MVKTNRLRIKIIFLFATIFIIALSIMSYIRIKNLIEAADMVNHTQKVNLELERAFTELVSAESAQRGFIHSKDSTFLAGHSVYVNNLNLHLDNLDALIKDTVQQLNQKELRNVINTRLDFMRDILNRSSRTTILPHNWLYSKKLMDEVRSLVNKMEIQEERLMQQRYLLLNKEAIITPLFTIFLIIGAILILISAYIKITKELNISHILKENIEQRTIELEIANESLQEKNQELAISKYNKRFLKDFSEKFSDYKVYNEFFNSVVNYISDLNHYDYVFLGKLKQDESNEQKIQTIAFSAYGKIVENITYRLHDGPCEQVISGEVYSYPEQCMSTFSENELIKQFNVQGYLGYPLKDAARNTIGLIAVMHSKKIEDEETIAAILKVVAKRTELEMERIKSEELLAESNKVLAKNNQELEMANKELESFTYISSHDLQEPLRKIQTFATRIIDEEEQNLSDKGKEYFLRMQNAAHRMQTLIEDLLAYSRTKLNERKFEKMHLIKILDEVKIDLKEELNAKNAIIEATELCEINIIPFQFRQLMHNLIGNALKFSKPDLTPNIKIKSKKIKFTEANNVNLEIGKEYCHISVTDNGIGFEPRYSNKIFEVFQRLHHKSDYKGTGIGLAIVKKIVDNHNGIITATGELNNGATFDIFIPAG